MKKKLTVLALAFAMVLSMSAVSVFADDVQGAASDDGKVYLTKELQIGQGVDVPSGLTFSFKGTKSNVARGTEGFEEGMAPLADYADLPAMTTEAFSNGDRASGADEVLVKSVTIDLASIMAGKHAGIYKWTIEEISGSDTTHYTYATNKYTLRVYMVNDGNTTKIGDVTIVPQKADGTDEDNTKKIDASKPDTTPDDPTTDPKEGADEDGDGNYNNDGNGFRFINKYVPDEVTTNPDPTNHNGAFSLKKIAAGTYADKTQDFTFTVNIKLPKTAADNYSMANKGSIKESGKDDVAQTLNASKTGADNSITLHHGQEFSISSLPQGTVITVKEDAAKNFTGTYKGKHTVIGTSGAAATDLVGNEDAPTGASVKTHANFEKDVEVIAAGTSTAPDKNVVVGSTGAYVDFTNSYADDNVTPTGIIINNLPYVLLIGLALGGIVLFSRKRRYE